MGDRDSAMDSAVRRLDEDLAVVESTQDNTMRAQLRSEAEHRYLTTVRGHDHA